VESALETRDIEAVTAQDRPYGGVCVMKDPLQTEKAPWAVLGIQPDADKATVEEAFLNAFGRIPPIKATRARDAMLNPVKRARYELLYFDDAVLAGLIPNPVADTSALDAAKRMSTAVQWENQLKKRFPDPAISRSIAVLWYQWTLHEEERLCALVAAAAKAGTVKNVKPAKRDLLRQIRRAEGVTCQPGDHQCVELSCSWRQDCLSSAPPLEEMWRKVIAYWSMLAHTSHFWDGGLRISQPHGDTLQKEFLEELRSRLLTLRQRYSSALEGNNEVSASQQLEGLACVGAKTAKALAEAGITTLRDVVRVGSQGVMKAKGITRKSAEEIVKAAEAALEEQSAPSRQYFELGVDLACELESAEAMAGFGARTPAGKICCGVLMLKYMGLLETMRSQVRAAALKGSSTAAKLEKCIVPGYLRVQVLLRDNKPEEALSAIDSMPADERKSPEIVELRTKALMVLGKKRESVDRIEDALDCWEQALRGEHTRAMDNELRNQIVSSCLEAANSKKVKETDRAIDILEHGYRIVRDEKLQVLLAEMLNHRGVATFDKGQELLKGKNGKRPSTREVMPVFEKGIADLRRARDLGSKDAAKNLAAAESIVAEAKEGMLDLPEGAQELLKKSYEASQRSDYDTAISCLREVVRLAGERCPAQIRKSLAIALSNQAMDNRNRAIGILNEEVENHNRRYEQVIAMLKAGRTHMPYFHSAFEQRSCAMCGNAAGYSFKISEGETVGLCERHVGEVRSMIETPPPNAQAIALLQAAERGFFEAAHLDPDGGAPKENLEEVRQLLSKLGVAPRDYTRDLAATAKRAKAQAPKREQPAAPPKAPKQSAPAAQARSAQGQAGKKTAPAAETPKRSPQKRNAAHACLIFLMWLAAVTVALEHLPVGTGSLVHESLYIWNRGGFQRFVVLFATVLSAGTVAAGLGVLGVAWVWNGLCRKRWRDKSGFERFVEVAMYVFVTVAVMAYL